MSETKEGQAEQRIFTHVKIYGNNLIICLGNRLLSIAIPKITMRSTIFVEKYAENHIPFMAICLFQNGMCINQWTLFAAGQIASKLELLLEDSPSNFSNLIYRL